jgi:transcriptional regulator with XRE-family HTH domain
MPKRNDPCLPKIRAQALGAAIRAARGSLSQTGLGELVGRPQATVSTWENGQVAPSLEMIGRIEEALDLPYGSLLVADGYVSLPALSNG